MEIPPGIIGAISAAIAVPIFMALIGRVKSFQPEKKTGKDFDELCAEYSKWERLGLVLLFIFSPLIGFSIWFTLDFSSSLITDSLEDSVFIFSPTTAVWALPAIFLSIFLSVIPLHFIFLKLLGNKRYAEYTEYGNLKHGMDSWKVLKYMAYLFIPICLFFSALALDSYIRITNTTFIVNNLLSIGEREYRFEEIRSIELTKSFKAPNGNIVRRSYYTVNFIDGNTHEFDNSLNELNFDQQQKIVSFIIDRVDVEMEVKDPYPA